MKWNLQAPAETNQVSPQWTRVSGVSADVLAETVSNSTMVRKKILRPLTSLLTTKYSKRGIRIHFPESHLYPPPPTPSPAEFTLDPSMPASPMPGNKASSYAQKNSSGMTYIRVVTSTTDWANAPNRFRRDLLEKAITFKGDQYPLASFPAIEINRSGRISVNRRRTWDPRIAQSRPVHIWWGDAFLATYCVTPRPYNMVVLMLN